MIYMPVALPRLCPRVARLVSATQSQLVRRIGDGEQEGGVIHSDLSPVRGCGRQSISYGDRRDIENKSSFGGNRERGEDHIPVQGFANAASPG
jgi:hypothetical protein